MIKRLFIKELLEFYGNKNIFLLIFIVPVFLIYISGNVKVRSIQFRVFVEQNAQAYPASEDLKMLFSEISSIELLDTLEGHESILLTLEANRLDIYFKWDDSWIAYTSQTSGVRKSLLKASTNQLFYLINSLKSIKRLSDHQVLINIENAHAGFDYDRIEHLETPKHTFPKPKVLIEEHRGAIPSASLLKQLFALADVDLLDSLKKARDTPPVSGDPEIGQGTQIGDWDLLDTLGSPALQILFRWNGFRWKAHVSDTLEYNYAFIREKAEDCLALLDAYEEALRTEKSKERPIDKVLSDLRLLNQSRLVELYPQVHRHELTLVTEIMALICIFIAFWLAASTYNKEKDGATLEVLLASPKTSWMQIFVAKIIVIVLISIFNLFILILFAETFFGLNIKTNFFAMALMMLIAIFSSCFLGLSVSLLSNSQWKSAFISAFYLISLILLTGVAFPISEASELIRYLSKLFPLSFTLEPFKAWIQRGVSSFYFPKEWLFLTIQFAVYGLFTYVLLIVKRRAY